MKTNTDNMKERKAINLKLRVASQTKEALLYIGERENRNIVSTLEWLIVDYNRRNKLAMPKIKENQ